jgi:hypothetical protein
VVPAKYGNFIKSQYGMLNSAFNAQGSRVIILLIHEAAGKKYICSSSGGAQEKGKTG